MQTAFVNPALQALFPSIDSVSNPAIYSAILGLAPYSDAEMSPEEKAAFEDRMDSHVIEQLGQALHAGKFDAALVLTDPDAGCNFNETIMRHADGSSADAFDFLRINLFVRLWKRLDWTIQEVDQALQVLIPSSLSPLTGTTIGPAFKMALARLGPPQATG